MNSVKVEWVGGPKDGEVVDLQADLHGEPVFPEMIVHMQVPVTREGMEVGTEDLQVKVPIRRGRRGWWLDWATRNPR